MNYPRIKTVIREFYHKLFQINDTAQKISLGAGLGVFLGIMPGMGPVAALFVAHFLRVNKAAALIGSLLTNTWLSLMTFFLSLKVGAAAFNLNWRIVYDNLVVFLKNFSFSELFSSKLIEFIIPIVCGYIIVAFCAGVLVYLSTFFFITLFRKSKSKILPPVS